MSSKSVIVASQDALQRRRLAGEINQMPDFQTVARSADLMQTFTEVEEKLPNVVLISDILAQAPEFEVMRALFTEKDVRWLVLEETKRSNDVARAKRSDLFLLSANVSAAQLAAQLRALTHSSATPKHSTRGMPTARPNDTQFERVILIGSSTGGVDALLSVLSHFPQNCPPTVIVQHTGAGFGESLASLLNRQCRAEVVLAQDSISLRRGLVVIGAGTKCHVQLKTNDPIRAQKNPGIPVSGHIPSVDALFQSAVPLGRRVVAGLLTGMGRDGASGLKALRDVGAQTLAQDEATCVVYGMPKAAAELGGADRILPLQDIGPALLDMAQQRGSLQKRRA